MAGLLPHPAPANVVGIPLPLPNLSQISCCRLHQRHVPIEPCICQCHCLGLECVTLLQRSHLFSCSRTFQDKVLG